MSKRSTAGSGAGRVSAAEAAEHSGAGSDAETGALAAESIGRYLSQQRRLRGISVHQLGEMTRIPVRSIERLEAGHFDDDIDGFVRGFVRTVSQALGLDPEDALVRMLAEPRGEPEPGRPVTVLLGRSLVGLFVIAAVALAVGLVRVAVRGSGTPSPAPFESSLVVWRSDPVRALAEANAAVRDEAPDRPTADAAPPE
jgi:hypothetical protein